MNVTKFCPTCDKVLFPKEDLEKVQLFLACRRCNYQEPAGDAIVYYEEFPEKHRRDDTPLPETRGVKCPNCGHRRAGFFEMWAEDMHKMVRDGLAVPWKKQRVLELQFDEALLTEDGVEMMDTFLMDSDEDEAARISNEELHKQRALRRANLLDKMRKENEMRKAEVETSRNPNSRPTKHKSSEIKKHDQLRSLFYVCCNPRCNHMWEGD